MKYSHQLPMIASTVAVVVCAARLGVEKVTVCIAARSQGNLVLASDRMLTAGDIQFEPPTSKMALLTSSIALMAIFPRRGYDQRQPCNAGSDKDAETGG